MIAKRVLSAVAVAGALVAGLAPGVSAEAQTVLVPSAFTVVAHLDTNSVRVGHSATISGSVAPARPGKPVYLQQDRFGAWKTIGTSKLNAASQYSFTVTPAGSGPKLYRVVKLREGAIHRATSPTRRLNSYRWFRLDQMPFSQQDGIFTNPETINGIVFDHALYADLSVPDASEVAEIELFRSCTSVRGTLGLTELSDASSQADIAISVDGAPRLDYQPTTNDSQHFRVPVAGARHFRVDLRNLTDAHVYPAIGGGQALCAIAVPPLVP
jgi:hypothetical protein